MIYFIDFYCNLLYNKLEGGQKMIDIEELSKRITYYRAIKKISLTDLAAILEISINTLQKIIKKEHVKETTRIYVWEKLNFIEKEGE